MVRKLRTIGAVALVGLAAVAACSRKSGDGNKNDSDDAGAGGASAGNSNAGGNVAQGGSFVPRAGSSGKGGNSGSGSGGTEANPAGNGQGGAADPCAHCASGMCDADLNCKNCIGDDECTSGLVCGNGVCSAACTAAQEGQTMGCDNGLTCCSQHCTDVAIDSAHCGACGAACDDGQFCGLTACGAGAGGASGVPCVACHPTTLASICSVGQVIVILDTTKNDSDGNRVPGRAIGAAIKAQCAPTPTLTEAEQDSVEALNLTTGRPVSAGNELLVVAGGPFYQNLEGYMEEQHIAPLYLKAMASGTQFRKNSDDSVVASLPIDGVDHDSHDFFLIQFMRDAASGSLALNAQGFWLSGTVAATYQMTNAVLPDLASFNKAWYVYEWSDADADKAPDANEIVLVDSGL